MLASFFVSWPHIPQTLTGTDPNLENELGEEFVQMLKDATEKK